MNLRGGWALIRGSLFSLMSSRGFFWTIALGRMMGPLVYMLVWITAAGQGGVSGFGRGDFVVYYLCLTLVNQLTYPNCNWTVGGYIRAGLFSIWMLRPVPAMYEAIASNVAMAMVCMPFALFVTVVLGAILHPSWAFSLSSVLAFVPALLLSCVLRFLLAYNLALLAFWHERADALLGLYDTLVFLFAGQVAPIAVLPAGLQRAAQALPFRYTLGFPIEVLMGRLAREELVLGLVWQMCWLAVAVLLHQLVWRQGLRHYTAIGG